MSMVKRAIRTSRANEYWYLAHQRQQQRENKKNDKQTEESGQTD